jgi:hypothetical protein
MKKLFTPLFSGLLTFWVLISLVGCGITKLAEETRDQVTHTNDQLNTSNDKQTQLLEATRKLQELTTQLITGMQTTNNAVHLQVLTVSLQELLAPANTEVLVPPVRMFPYAETFAKEASPDEIIQIFHVFLADAILGGTSAKPNAEGKFDPNDIRLTSRRISLAAGSVIAAFIPEDKFKQILINQIDKGGRFADTTYVLANVRYDYLKQYFLGSILEKSETVNIGSVRTAVGYFNSMKLISRLAYADKIKLHVPSFVTDPNNAQNLLDLDQKLDSSADFSGIGRKAIRRFNRDAALKAQLETTDEGKLLSSQFTN